MIAANIPSFKLSCVIPAIDTHIYVGDNTMFGPNVTVATAGHPILPELRQQGYQYNAPIHIGENCWIGAGKTSLIIYLILFESEVLFGLFFSFSCIPYLRISELISITGKTYGDLVGPAIFAFFMGTSRTIYGKIGEKINLNRMIFICSLLCVGS